MPDTHSDRCSSREYWSTTARRCEPCEEQFEIRPGFEFTPNCGLSDDGGRHEPLYKPCRGTTFNDGTSAQCKSCSTCPSSLLASACTAESDSRCCGEGQHVEKGVCKDGVQPPTVKTTAVTTEQPTTTTSYMSYSKGTLLSNEITQSTHPTTTIQAHPTTTVQTHPTKTTQTHPTTTILYSQHDQWIWLSALTSILLLCIGLFCVFYFLKQRKHCREIKQFCCEKNLRNHKSLDGSSEHLKSGSKKDLLDLNNFLSPETQASPLQSVLNNLDVVEELVLLLDPDTPGAKNTRHLAASCSIPFTWINYAYSMKDSRSPLIAVLEKVIAKNPNWNVGHLAGLLSNIGRNDAVAVLGKLTLPEEEV
ncbi:IGF-like family receptor 1 [Salminus brasiliensis]|uniref:IGF-like family receptor 1 n=1 Tax=Salminus brasiliensis TaxID=930266 RepID=UPI003B837FBC